MRWNIGGQPPPPSHSTILNETKDENGAENGKKDENMSTCGNAINAIFEDAIIEQKEKGDDSSLHIIIFDEIDAICKQRGSSGTGSGSGVHDTVVNQLLSMIDDVNSLNNVIIGMTNRKDLLDDALRSGRLEVHIEIGLPDQEGREQIFRIHTKSLRDNGFLDENISISNLAKRTKNYTGAEIEGVVQRSVKKVFFDINTILPACLLKIYCCLKNFFSPACCLDFVTLILKKLF